LTAWITPVVFFDLTVLGLVSAGFYILLASGITLIFGVMRIVNLAQGQFVLLGGYVTFSISESVIGNSYLAIIPSMFIVAALAVVIERLTFRRVLGRSLVGGVSQAPFFIGFGLLYILENAMSQIWGDQPLLISSPFITRTVRIGTINVSADWIIVILCSFLVTVGLYVFLQKTSMGRAIRATSQNKNEAMLAGINVGRIYSLTFGIGIGLGVLGGSLMGIVSAMTPDAGSDQLFIAFAIIILGGLGSVEGAVVGGLVYGIVGSFTSYYLGGYSSEALIFLVMAAVLIVRPAGIFGIKTAVET
jgi:branched-chain amino acid transport system permease protein